MFTFCFLSTASSQLKKTSGLNALRLIRTALVVLTAIFTMASFAEAGGFGHSFGGSSGGSKNFAQTFSKSQNTQKTTSSNNPKTITLKQNDKPQKFSMEMKEKEGSCHEKCHCHHYCSYDYPCWYGWDYCDGIDLQLLSVRMLETGDAAKKLGPTFRVWFRNNSSVAIDRPFSLTAMMLGDDSTEANLPRAGVRIGRMGAGQMMSVDVRMPIEAAQPGLPMLQVTVDSHREISETNKSNNTMMMKLAEVMPVETITKPAETPTLDTPPAPTTDTPPAPPVDPKVQAEISKESTPDEPTSEEEEN